jgi:protein ImuB
VQPVNDDGLDAIAQEFSPRYERHGDDLIVIDVRGLERLLGAPPAIAHELRREAAGRGVRAHVAIAGTRIAAVALALARPGITVVDPGQEAAALAAIPINILEKISYLDPGPLLFLRVGSTVSTRAGHSLSPARPADQPPKGPHPHGAPVSDLQRWGLKTLGELAALPAAELSARLGQEGLAWQAIARGEDLHPLVPTLADERFVSTLELEWPIEGLEPLSFVLTRLLEPLSTRLERHDRGAAVLHVHLGLVTKVVHARRLELPAPLREVRTLRTLALVDLESHPPPAAIDCVSIVIDPTPARVLQHTLFSRAQHNPDVISTLLARLGALMGQDRIGAPALVDTYRPGAFAMAAFITARGAPCLGSVGPSLSSGVARRSAGGAKAGPPRAEDLALERSLSRSGEACHDDALRRPELANTLNSVLRRFRQSIPARVIVESERPVRVTTDRRGFAGGSVVACAGPWRTSGAWWEGEAEAAPAAIPSRATFALRATVAKGRPLAHCSSPGLSASEGGRRGISEETRRGWPASAEATARPPELARRIASEGGGPGASEKKLAGQVEGAGRASAILPSWNRDEWDVALNDGAVYRLFQDRETGGWFIEGIVD